MGAESLQVALQAAAWVGEELLPEQQSLMIRFHDWMSSEAIQAGGLGPHERPRIWSRHIADSLLFGIELGTKCLDIGSGVGLPGIPLAVMRPDVSFILLDRSGRRCDLMRRAIAVLGLGNCQVVELDIADLEKSFDSVVSRAAVPPEKMMFHVKRCLMPGGTAVLGLSHTGQTSDLPKNPAGFTSVVVAVPADVLDTGVNLLRIEAT